MKTMQQDIEQAVTALAQDFDATEIWLFGSQARGTATGQSDIDLLIVRAARPQSSRPSVEARLCLSRHGIRHPFDLLVLTPQRWREMQHRPFGVYADVLQRGVKVYER